MSMYSPQNEGGGRQMVVHLRGHTLAINAPTVLSGPTKRPAVVVLWSSSGKPFKLANLTNGAEWYGKAALLAPHFVRSTQANDCGIISLNFEPGHPYHTALAGMAGETGLRTLELGQVIPFSADLSHLIGSGEGLYLDNLTLRVAEFLLAGQGAAQRFDKRIAAVVEQLECELAAPPSVGELAKAAHLSEDRLSHLFTEQVGLSLRSYIVWRRYRKALLALTKHSNLASVAQTAGFYDQAHMTRTFVGFFGYQPSVLRNRGFIRIVE